MIDVWTAGPSLSDKSNLCGEFHQDAMALYDNTSAMCIWWIRRYIIEHGMCIFHPSPSYTPQSGHL